MEHFDISKAGSGLFMPIDDNINQWTSLYNTRMHYRMLADQQRQQSNKQKAGDMVKALDQVLAVTANPMFDGSADNKLINDTIGKYRNYIIDAKSGLLAGDMSYLEDAANVLSQFSKDLDPNGNAIKTLGKQNYLVSQIQKIKDRVKNTNLYNLDATREVDATINQLISKYNNNEINIDQLTQGINSIDDRNYRSLKQFIDEAEKISQDEWDSLSPDNMWKINTKSINQNKAASLLLRAVNYAGGTDADLFNFYKVVKDSKGKPKKEYLSQEDYNKLVESNNNATDDKQNVQVGADLKTDIRQCTTRACRRVLGEVYPVMKGTSRTKTATKYQETNEAIRLKRAESNINREQKVWETQLQSLIDYKNVLIKELENQNLSEQERNSLTVALGKANQAIQEWFQGKTATETVTIPNNNVPITEEQFQGVVNGNGTTGSRTADMIAKEQQKIGTVLVDINDKKGTVDAIFDNIKKYHKDLFAILNAKGQAKKALEILVSNGIEEMNKQGLKGNNGKVNATQLLKLANKAEIHNIIGDDETDTGRQLDFIALGHGAHPAFLGKVPGNNIGAILEQSGKDKLKKALKEANELPSLNGTQNVSFAVFHNPVSISTVMNEMNTDGATFISTSTVPGDPIKTLQGVTVKSVIGYGISKLGEPVFKVIYNDHNGSYKSDIFVYKNMKKDNLINSLNATESINERTIPKFVKDSDYLNSANFSAEQNRVLDEADKGVKDFVKDYNHHKANNSEFYEDDNNNQYYSYDVPYGNNIVTFTILKDANGNLTNRYTASTVINGKTKQVKLYIGMQPKERNKAIYHELLR